VVIILQRAWNGSEIADGCVRRNGNLQYNSDMPENLSNLCFTPLIGDVAVFSVCRIRFINPAISVSIMLWHSLLAATARLALILMPLQHIFSAVPLYNRKAETWSTDLDVWPSPSPFGGQEVGDAGTIADKLPTSIDLFADQAVAGTCISVAIGAALNKDHRPLLHAFSDGISKSDMTTVLMLAQYNATSPAYLSYVIDSAIRHLQKTEGRVFRRPMLLVGPAVKCNGRPHSHRSPEKERQGNGHAHPHSLVVADMGPGQDAASPFCAALTTCANRLRVDRRRWIPGCLR